MRYIIRYWDEGHDRYDHDLFGGAAQEATSPAAALLALGIEELRPHQQVDLRDWAVEVSKCDYAVIGHADYPGQTVSAEEEGARPA
jgi:hypothetical protein